VRTKSPPNIAPAFKLFSLKNSHENKAINSGYDISMRPERVAFLSPIERTINILAMLNATTIATTSVMVLFDENNPAKSVLYDPEDIAIASMDRNPKKSSMLKSIGNRMLCSAFSVSA